jgi:PAS domain S-box-containing protein
VLLNIPIIAGFALGAVLASTIGVVNNYSLDRARDSLIAARGVFDRLIETRADGVARQLRLVTETNSFRQSIENAGLESITGRTSLANLTESYCRKLGAGFCVATDAQGRWLGQSHAPRDRAARPIAGVIDTARAGQPGRAIVSWGDGPVLLVAEPVKSAGEITGTLAAGYRLDDSMAAELAMLTRGEVAFICEGGSVCGASLSDANRTALEALLKGGDGGAGSLETFPLRWTLAGTPFIAAVHDFPRDAGRPVASGAAASPQAASGPAAPRERLILLHDWTPAARALMQIRTALAWVGIWTVGVAVGGVILLSRRLTRPLRDLASAAHEIAGGNWGRRVPVDGPAEARTMARAFNHMTVTLSHWHEEATSQAARLRESNERFRSVTDSAQDAIISVNSRGEIVFWNLRAQAVFGYDEREASGRELTQLISRSDREQHADQIARLWKIDSPWMGRTVELHIVSRDGREVPVELSLSTWTAGNEAFYTLLIRDITERRQAAEVLRQREDELRHAQKMEAVGRLAGGIAHDFNNLLTGILGYADLILEGLPPGSRIRNDVEGIRKAGRSAAALTRELLAFSRKQVVQPAVLDLNEVVRGTEGLLRRLIGADTLLILHLGDDGKTVKADRSQIEQVLLNLATNARDAMPDGGTLTIRTDNAGGNQGSRSGNTPLSTPHVIIAVSDTGHGMTADVRSHIFEPFFTTKEPGKGTGLGLSTVYGIVAQSGGYIHVDSEPGKGATFTIGLPAVEAAVARPDHVSDITDRSLHGSETILLVEDNASVRAMARETLTRYGYRVLEAENGQEALAIAAANLHGLSLVVTDVVMPVMGGRELATRLKTLRRSLKVLFTSGYADGPVRPDIPPGRFLAKPFTPSMLGRKVRELLDSGPASDASQARHAQVQGTRS